MAHDHGHDHDPYYFGRAFAMGVTLNLAFVVIEALYGWQTGSQALLAKSSILAGFVNAVVQPESESDGANCPTACGF